MPDIQTPNGESIRLPNYAMESTAQAILKALGNSGKHLGNIEKVLIAYTKENAEVAKILKDLERVTKEGNEQAKKDSKKGREQDKEENKKLRDQIADTLDLIDGKVFGAFGAMSIVFAGTVGALVNHVTGLGDTVADLAQTGLGFANAQGSIVDTISGMNALGISVQGANEILKAYSDVVVTTGRQSFMAATQELDRLTDGGSKFGLTMGQMAEVMGYNMKISRRAGILDETESKTAATRSARLYKKQLDMTERLGVPISELQAASEETVTSTNFMLTAQRIAGSQTAAAANNMMEAVQETMADLKASGIEDSLLNMLGDAATGPAAMLTEGGQQLFGAFQMIGGQGAEQAKQAMMEYSKAVQSGDPKAIRKAEERLKNGMASMGKDLSKMSEQEKARLQLMAQSNPAMKSMLDSAVAAANAQRNEANQRAEANGKFGKELAGIATTSKAFQNSLAKLSGATDMAMNVMANSFSPILEGFMGSLENTADVVDDSGKLIKKGEQGVLSAFQDMMKDIAGAFSAAIGGTAGDVNSLGEGIRNWLVPRLKEVGDWFKNGGMQKIISAFQFMGGVITGVARVFGMMYDVTKTVVDFFMMIPRAIGATLDFFGKFFNGLGQLFGWVKPVGENGEQLAQTVEQTVSSAAQFGKAIGAVMGGLMAMSIGLKAFRGMKALWDGGKASWKAITSIWKKGGAAAEAASNTTQGKTGNRLSNLFGGGDDDSKDRGKDQKGGKTGKGSKGLDAKKMFGGVDAKGLLAIGGAMVMVAGAVWILSDALTKIAEIPSDRIWEVTGVMGAIAGGAALITGAMILLAPVVTASIPALLAIGGAFLAVGAGVGIASAGIGKLAEGFAKLKTAGAEADAIKMRAQADATERLSKIPAERIHAVADAIKSMSSALATMGDTVGSDGWFSDSGVDIDKQMEQVSVFKMFASVDSAGIIETSSALNTMIDTYGRFATLDLDSISKATRVMAEVKEATDPGLLTKATNFFGGLFGSDEPEVKKPEPQETPKPEQSKTEPKQKEAPKPEQTKTEPKQKPSGELEKDLWKRNRRDMNPYERAIDKQERTRARLEKQQLATPKSYLGNTNTADTAPEPPRPDTEAVKPVELSTTLSEADVARMDPAQKAMLELMAQLVKNTETSAIESKRSRKTLSSIHQDW